MGNDEFSKDDEKKLINSLLTTMIRYFRQVEQKNNLIQIQKMKK